MAGTSPAMTRGDAFGPPRFGCYKPGSAWGRGEGPSMFRVLIDTRALRAGFLLAGMLALAGCGGGGGVADSSGGSFTDRMSSTLFGPPASAAAPAATAAELDCPGVDIRAGGST